ncbi:MAG: DUF4342 domain-containing protein [Candidatus Paceibacterota bacterium]|jgi:hypothetical protein
MAKLNRKIIEKQVKVSADRLLAKAKQIIEKGGAHELVISNPSGKIELQLPLIKGAAIGTVAAIVAPFLTAVAGIAALATHHTIEVRRKTDTKKKK